MRPDDIRHLKQRYGVPAEGGPEVRLGEYTGLPIDAVVRLGDEILNDLDRSVHGVRWWEQHLPHDERVLISDQLIACTRAIGHNVFEAYTGLLEYRHAVADFDELLQRGVARDGSFRFPPPRGPYDDLVAIREDASVAAIVRALGSALDCLGGTIVGVAALPINIVRADLGQARTALTKITTADPADPRSALTTALNDAVASAGPDGWLEWLTALRNTVVHRGRRVTSMSSSLVPTTRGERPRLVSVRVLPSSPGLTEVEAWQQPGGYLHSLLTEPAEITLRECIRCTAEMIEASAQALLTLWLSRRATPDLIRQPRVQSPTPRPDVRLGFAGFAPDPALTGDVRSLAMPGEAELRFAAAGLVQPSG